MPKYQIDIEMDEPEDCSSCPFDYDGITCCAVLLDNGKGYKNCRHHEADVYNETEEWCPLQEIKEENEDGRKEVKSDM